MSVILHSIWACPLSCFSGSVCLHEWSKWSSWSIKLPRIFEWVFALLPLGLADVCPVQMRKQDNIPKKPKEVQVLRTGALTHMYVKGLGIVACAVTKHCKKTLVFPAPLRVVITWSKWLLSLSLDLGCHAFVNLPTSGIYLPSWICSIWLHLAQRLEHGWDIDSEPWLQEFLYASTCCLGMLML